MNHTGDRSEKAHEGCNVTEHGQKACAAVDFVNFVAELFIHSGLNDFFATIIRSDPEACGDNSPDVGLGREGLGFSSSEISTTDEFYDLLAEARRNWLSFSI